MSGAARNPASGSGPTHPSSSLPLQRRLSHPMRRASAMERDQFASLQQPGVSMMAIRPPQTQNSQYRRQFFPAQNAQGVMHHQARQSRPLSCMGRTLMNDHASEPTESVQRHAQLGQSNGTCRLTFQEIAHECQRLPPEQQRALIDLLSATAAREEDQRNTDGSASTAARKEHQRNTDGSASTETREEHQRNTDGSASTETFHANVSNENALMSINPLTVDAAVVEEADAVVAKTSRGKRDDAAMVVHCPCSMSGNAASSVAVPFAADIHSSSTQLNTIEVRLPSNHKGFELGGRRNNIVTRVLDGKKVPLEDDEAVCIALQKGWKASAVNGHHVEGRMVLQHLHSCHVQNQECLVAFEVSQDMLKKSVFSKARGRYRFRQMLGNMSLVELDQLSQTEKRQLLRNVPLQWLAVDSLSVFDVEVLLGRRSGDEAQAARDFFKTVKEGNVDVLRSKLFSPSPCTNAKENICLMRDGDGNVPLHHAKDEQVVRALMEKDPQARNVRNAAGQLPINSYIQRNPACDRETWALFSMKVGDLLHLEDCGISSAMRLTGRARKSFEIQVASWDQFQTILTSNDVENLLPELEQLQPQGAWKELLAFHCFGDAGVWQYGKHTPRSMMRLNVIHRALDRCFESLIAQNSKSVPILRALLQATKGPQCELFDPREPYRKDFVRAICRAQWKTKIHLNNVYEGLSGANAEWLKSLPNFCVPEAQEDPYSEDDSEVLLENREGKYRRTTPCAGDGKCSVCEGAGQVDERSSTCWNCGGHGRCPCGPIGHICCCIVKVVLLSGNDLCKPITFRNSGAETLMRDLFDCIRKKFDKRRYKRWTFVPSFEKLSLDGDCVRDVALLAKCCELASLRFVKAGYFFDLEQRMCDVDVLKSSQFHKWNPKKSSFASLAQLNRTDCIENIRTNSNNIGRRLPQAALVQVSVCLGRILARSQDLPDGSFCDYSDLVDCNSPPIIISHPWGSRNHPDPTGSSVQKICRFIKRRFKKLDAAAMRQCPIFMDFLSLFQWPRSKKQEHIFRNRQLTLIGLLMRHEKTCVLRLNGPPPEDVRVVNKRPYHQRGWCAVESRICEMKTDPGLAVSYHEWETGQTDTSYKVMTPEEFEDELQGLLFTCGDVDRAIVANIYRQTCQIDVDRLGQCIKQQRQLESLPPQSPKIHLSLMNESVQKFSSVEDLRDIQGGKCCISLVVQCAVQELDGDDWMHIFEESPRNLLKSKDPMYLDLGHLPELRFRQTRFRLPLPRWVVEPDFTLIEEDLRMVDEIRAWGETNNIAALLHLAHGEKNLVEHAEEDCMIAKWFAAWLRGVCQQHLKEVSCQMQQIIYPYGQNDKTFWVRSEAKELSGICEKIPWLFNKMWMELQNSDRRLEVTSERIRKLLRQTPQFVTDILGCTLIAGSLDDLRAVHARLESAGTTTHRKASIRSCKNGFLAEHSSPDGYRDISLHVELGNKMLVEVQLVLSEFQEMKENRMPIPYEVTRGCFDWPHVARLLDNSLDNIEEALRVRDSNKLREHGFDASMLREAAFSVDEMMRAGVTVKELRAVGVQAVELKKAGIDTLQLKQAGFDIWYLKEAGFHAYDLNKANFSIQQLKEVGFDAMELKGIGFDFRQLRDVGYTAPHMQKVGFNTQQLFAAGFDKLQLEEAGIDAHKLREAGIDAGNLKKLDFDARQVREAGFDAKHMKEGGYGIMSLKDVGFDDRQLRQAGFDAKQMKEAGYEITTLRDVGYNARELKEAGYGIMPMKDVGFDARQLKEAGFDARQMSEVGYDITTLRDVGYDARELKEAGCSIMSMKDVGFDGRQLREAGFGCKQMKVVGFSTMSLKEAGYSAKQMKEAGYDITTLRDVGFNARDLKAAGYGILAMKAVGVDAGELRDAGFACRQMKEAGFNTSMLKEAGYSAKQMTEAGYEITTLRDVGFNAMELMQAGCDTMSMKNAGFDARQLRQGGFNAESMKLADFSIMTLKEVGFDARELKAAGYSIMAMQDVGFDLKQLAAAGFDFMQMKEAGFSNVMLKEAGYSARQMKKAGYEITTLRDVGFNARELMAAGFGIMSIKAAGFDARQLREAGFDAKEMKQVGFDTIMLRDVGYDAEEMKRGGFDARQVRQAGFDARQLKQAGFDARQVREAGFDAMQLKEAGFDARQIIAVGYDITTLKDVGFDHKQLLESGFDLKDVREAGYTMSVLQGFGARELSEAGFDARQVRELAFDFRQTKEDSF